MPKPKRKAKPKQRRMVEKLHVEALRKTVVTKIRLPKSVTRDIQRIVDRERSSRRAREDGFIESEITAAKLMRAMIVKGIEAYDREHR